MDANGDGVGDFQGLIRRLDYLQGLGVTAIWLMPFQPSPQRDDGYDIADYYGVDPRYGTLGDFVEFTHGCKQRGIRVLIDLVVNHTSDQHPWFQSARQDKDSQVSRLVCLVEEASRRTATDGIVFPGRAEDRPGRATRWRGEYYFHRFYEFQPDLNTANPAVQAEILKIMGFWLQLGVSGFRMDAVPFVIAEKGAGRRPSPSSNTTCCARSASSCSGARARRSSWPRPTSCRTPTWSISATSGERLQMMFNFQVNQTLFYALAAADSRPLAQALAGDRAAAGDRAMGACSCATTTSSTSGRLTDDAARRRCSPPSARTRTCSSTTAASAAGSRRCCRATAAGSSWPTA